MVPNAEVRFYESETARRVRLLPMEQRMQYRHLRKEWLNLWWGTVRWVEEGYETPRMQSDYEKLQTIEFEKDIIQNKLDELNCLLQRKESTVDQNDRLMKAIINLSEADATVFLTKENRPFCVVERDGEGQMVSSIYDENRVRLVIKDSKVVGITFG